MRLKFSPDGRWLAYVSNETGEYAVYIRAYPSKEHKVRVSADGGKTPRWRGDGKELFYVDKSGMLTAVPITENGSRLAPGVPEPLFPVSSMYSNVPNYQFAPEYTYDITADGQRILALWRPPKMVSPPLRVITNWEALLDQDE